ncbi:MAG: hypothetical protein OXF11_21265 [Deltaproteobacteria bacterium]|nr:hypothetical protein [Deltaproteobacteria bacterium]
MVEEAIHAVQLINASLPDAWKLRFAKELATGSTGRPADGEILIDFRPREDWPDTALHGRYEGGFAQRWFDPRHPLVSGRVWIDTTPGAQGGFQPRSVSIVHQLLHTLSFTLSGVTTRTELGIPIR